MGRDGATDVMVMRPTVAEFSRPFTDYVRKVLKKHPDIPMFKVVPPPGWKPRRRPFPKLGSVEIATPIKQIVYGKGGVYRCILMEQKCLTAERFQELSESDAHRAPESKRGKDEADALLERSFWSSVTINPPFYGADTPQSFFDERLDYGWNLRHLDGCLLRRSGVPDIPGVTTPMTYFGMWKAFFSWHVEDADLYSINYLHFGAPKVWYCVAPSQRAKFERMAQSLYPELHRSCRAFMRHKDCLLSPQMLRTYGVEYTMAKQEANEFIVLNAAAYHAGYNLGFNCAEAINFALPEWVDIGRAAGRCKCDAMKDGVRLSMRLFGLDTDSSEEESDEDDSSGTDATDSGDSDGEEEEEEEEAEEEEEEEEEGAVGTRRSARQRKASTRTRAPAAAAAAPATGSKRAAPAPAVAPEPKRPKGRTTRTAIAAATAASKQRSTRTSAEARAKLATKAVRSTKVSSTSAGSEAAKSGVHPTEQVLASLEKAAVAAVAVRAAHEARARAVAAQRAAAARAGSSSGGSSGGAAGAASDSGAEDTDAADPVSGSEPSSPSAARAALRRGARLAAPAAGEVAAAPGPSAGPPPQVIVGESSSGKRFFYVVQTLRWASSLGRRPSGGCDGDGSAGAGA